MIFWNSELTSLCHDPLPLVSYVSTVLSFHLTVCSPLKLDIHVLLLTNPVFSQIECRCNLSDLMNWNNLVHFHWAARLYTVKSDAHKILGTSFATIVTHFFAWISLILMFHTWKSCTWKQHTTFRSSYSVQSRETPVNVHVNLVCVCVCVHVCMSVCVHVCVCVYSRNQKKVPVT